MRYSQLSFYFEFQISTEEKKSWSSARRNITINAVKVTEDFVRLRREGEEVLNRYISQFFPLIKKDNKKISCALFIRISQNS